MLAARLGRTAGRRLRRGRRGTGEVLEKHLTVGLPRGQHALARGGQRHARHGTGVDIPLVQTRTGERPAAIGREQREDVPVDLLRRRAIEQVQPALARRKHPHAAATAGAGGLGPRRSFRREARAAVRRSRQPHSPRGFPGITCDVVGVPRHIHRTGLVHGERAAAVDVKRVRRQVPLRLEGRALRVGPGIEHRAAGALRLRVRHAPRQRRVGAVPGHVHPSIRTGRNLRAANRAGRDRAARLAVDAERPGERPAAIGRRDVEQISSSRGSREVDEMDDAVASGRNLRLNAAVRHALDVDGWRRSDRPRRVDAGALGRKQPGCERDGNHPQREDGASDDYLPTRPTCRRPRPAGQRPARAAEPANPRTREVSSTLYVI